MKATILYHPCAHTTLNVQRTLFVLITNAFAENAKKIMIATDMECFAIDQMILA